MLPYTGICLFTYHKYRKSIDSNVPLDAHGNPIEESENGRDLDGQLELGETAHLTAPTSADDFRVSVIVLMLLDISC